MHSAGIMLWRNGTNGPEVLLGHMGGPYWARKDAGAWTIPKGEPGDAEDPFATACREFEEEIGAPVPGDEFVDLGEIRQSAGKVVRAWAVEGDLDPTTASSNTFEMEWPPRSGRMERFAELDRVEWFDLPEARSKIVAGQRGLLDRLVAQLGSSPADDIE